MKLNTDNLLENSCKAKQRSALSFLKYFSFLDYIQLSIGLLFAIASSPLFSLSTVACAEFVKNLGTYFISLSDEESLRSSGRDAAIYVCYLATGSFICCVIFCPVLDRLASKKTSQLECAYLELTMKQNVDWLDTNASGKVSSNLQSKFSLVEDAIGSKLGYFFSDLGGFITGMFLSFYFNWKLALIICACAPIIFLPVVLSVIALNKAGSKSDDCKANVDSILDQTLWNITTVKVFNMTEKLLAKIEHYLQKLKLANYRKVLVFTISFASIFGIISAFHPAIFYFGTKLIKSKELKFDELVRSFCAFLVGTASLIYIAPSLQIILKGLEALREILTEMDELCANCRTKESDDEFDIGEGKIEFRDICFAYPSRSNVKVLNGLNLTIESGKCVALVGASGCGKSTCIQLIERFYKPIWGNILIDGRDINEMEIKYLRSQIGLVEQMPKLFTGSIAQNIAWGLNGTKLETESIEFKQNLVIETCKGLNIHNIISKLPNGYDTKVGEAGKGLSGGQKQLIAIARAIIKNPKILLLDEATSALDNKSQSIVQEALGKAMKSRTTVVIAHRLNTIKNADKIAVFKGGKVMELGTHEELLVNETGLYTKLVNSQNLNTATYVKRLSHLTDRRSKALSVVSVEYPQSQNRYSYVEQLVIPLTPQKLSESFDHSRKSSIKISHDSDYQGSDLIPELGKESHAGMIRTTIQLLKLCSPYWHILLLGLLAAIIQGFIFPAASLCIGNVFWLYLQSNSNMEEKVNEWNVYLVILAGVRFIGVFLQSFCFGVAGEALFVKLQLKLTDLIISQEVPWFEKPQNSRETLMGRLVNQPDKIRELIGLTFGNFVQIMFNLGLSSGLAIYLNWKFGLIAISIIPLKIIADYLAYQFIKEKKGKALELSYTTSEAISSMRTVFALNFTNHILTSHKTEISAKQRKVFKLAVLNGIIYGLVQFLQIASQGALVFASTQVIIDNDLGFKDMAIVWVCAFISEKNASDGLSVSKNLANGLIAASQVFNDIIQFKSLKLANRSENPKLEREIKGSIEFNNVNFRYPNNPEKLAIKNLNLKINAGQRVGIVGESGSGKSTLISLILQFYQPNSGIITLDSCNLTDYEEVSFKNQVSLVSQDIALFDMTIRENLTLGARYGEASPTQSEIEEAAREANIHDFIISLPQGYDTRLDGKGAQLSGGQKQRIAIARALIRNPKIIIFDEATSALDSESEKQVKEAIDKIGGARTIISIAHRLTTIMDHDHIIVMNQGEIIEQGKFNELKKLPAE
jgi:ATP-binding cassette subfamily B (MDR/TAP) protein 1